MSALYRPFPLDTPASPLRILPLRQMYTPGTRSRLPDRRSSSGISGRGVDPGARGGGYSTWMNRDREDAPAGETSAIPAESARILGPVSPASSLLRLQRTIGNRRVLKLLRETDPRMQWTKAAREENKGRDAQALPWNSPGDEMAGWKPLEILDKLTQVDENDTVTFTDEKRCGANAV